jgi:hypothetical protein
MLKPLDIPRIAPPSKEDFYSHYLRAGKPVVITGLVDSWAATSKWNFDYFESELGNVEAGVFRLKGGECDINQDTGSFRGSMPLRESIASVKAGNLNGGYAVATAMTVFSEEVQKQFSAPVYCADGKFLRSLIFMGPTGVVSSLHHDLPENLYVMVKGKKRITLFHPSAPVYPNSPFSKIPNHVQLDMEQPDYERFPKFKNAQPYVVDLVAGETLFIPHLWWHHLRNLEPSIAVNFWWSQGLMLPIAWAAAMYKKYRKI